MRENLNAIKRLVAFTLTVLLLGTTIWNDVFVIATEENHCSEYVDDQTYAANILQPVGEGDGYCDHCGQVEQAHVHAEEEPVVEEDAAVEEVQSAEDPSIEEPVEDITVSEEPQPEIENTEEPVSVSDEEISPEDTPVIDEETPDEDIEETDEEVEEDEEEEDEEKDKEGEEEECEHEWEYVSNNDGTHVKKCSKCGEESTEDCTFNEDGKCIHCGYVQEEECEHEWEYISNNDGTHIKRCKKCGEEITETCQLDENGICHDCLYEDERLIYQEFSKTFYGIKVMVKGMIPRGGTVDIYYVGTKAAENKVNDNIEEGTFRAFAAYDINIYYRDGSKYQPSYDDNTVEVTFSGVDELAETPDEEIIVYRIEEDNSVTEIEADVAGEEVSFEAEHFSEYVVGTEGSYLALMSHESFAAIATASSAKKYTRVKYASFDMYAIANVEYSFKASVYRNVENKNNPIVGEPIAEGEINNLKVTTTGWTTVQIPLSEKTTGDGYIVAGNDYAIVIDHEDCEVNLGYAKQDRGDSYTVVKEGETSWIWDSLCDNALYITTAAVGDVAATLELVDEPTTDSFESLSLAITDSRAKKIDNTYYIAKMGDSEEGITVTAQLNPNAERTITWSLPGSTTSGKTTTNQFLEITADKPLTAVIKTVNSGETTITAKYRSLEAEIRIVVLNIKINGVEAIGDTPACGVKYTGKAMTSSDVRVQLYKADAEITGNSVSVSLPQDKNVGIKDVTVNYIVGTTTISFVRYFTIDQIDIGYVLTDGGPNAFANAKFTFDDKGQVTAVTDVNTNNILTTTPEYAKGDFTATVTSVNGITYTIKLEGCNNFTGQVYVDYQPSDITTALTVELSTNSALKNCTYNAQPVTLTPGPSNKGWTELTFRNYKREVVTDLVISGEGGNATYTIYDYMDGYGAADYARNGKEASPKTAGKKAIVVTITSGGVSGSVATEFTIEKAELDNTVIEWTNGGDGSFLHDPDGKPVEPKPSVDFEVYFKGENNGELGALVDSTDYVTTYPSDHTNVGSDAILKITGAGKNFTTSSYLTKHYTIKPNFQVDAVVRISENGNHDGNKKNNYDTGYTRYYDGVVPATAPSPTALSPKLTVRLDKDLVYNQDYTYVIYDSYTKGGTTEDISPKVGTKYIVITPINDYAGNTEIVATYKVVPLPLSEIENNIVWGTKAKTDKTFNNRPHTWTTAISSGYMYSAKSFNNNIAIDWDTVASNDPDLTIKLGDNYLIEGKDFEIDYGSDYVNAGTVTPRIVGKGNFEGSVLSGSAYRYTIKPASITKPESGEPEAKASLVGMEDLTFDGLAKHPGVKVEIGTTFSEEYSYSSGNLSSANFDVVYDEKTNKSPGTSTITIKGKNNLTGTAIVSFNIGTNTAEYKEIYLNGSVQVNLTNDKLGENPINNSDGKRVGWERLYKCTAIDVYYKGENQPITFQVSVIGKDGVPLTKNKDFSYTFKNNTSVYEDDFDVSTTPYSAPYVKIVGINDYKNNNAIVFFNIKRRELTEDDVVVTYRYDGEKESYPYTGADVEVEDLVVKLKNDSTELTKGTDYTVTYPDNMSKTTAGEKSFTINFKDKYTGEVTKEYRVGLDIKDASVKISNWYDATDVFDNKTDSGKVFVTEWRQHAPMVRLKWSNGKEIFINEATAREPISAVDLDTTPGYTANNNAQDITGITVTANSSLFGAPAADKDIFRSRAAGNDEPNYNTVTLSISPSATPAGYYCSEEGGVREIKYMIKPVSFAKLESASHKVYTTHTAYYDYYGGDIPVTIEGYLQSGSTNNVATNYVLKAGDYSPDPFKLDGNNDVSNSYSKAIHGVGNFTDPRELTFTIRQGLVNVYIKREATDPNTKILPLNPDADTTGPTLTTTANTTASEWPFNFSTARGENYLYDGDEHVPDIVIKAEDGETPLTEDVDYTITKPADVTNIGTKVLTIKITNNNYVQDTIKVTYEIMTNDISSFVCELSDLKYTASTYSLNDIINSIENKSLTLKVKEPGTNGKELEIGNDFTIVQAASKLGKINTALSTKLGKNFKSILEPSEYDAQDNPLFVPSYKSNYIFIEGNGTYSGYCAVPFTIYLDISSHSSSAGLARVFMPDSTYTLTQETQHNVRPTIMYKSSSGGEYDRTISYDGVNSTVLVDNKSKNVYTISRDNAGKVGPDDTLAVVGQYICKGTATSVKYEYGNTVCFVEDLDKAGLSMNPSIYDYTGNTGVDSIQPVIKGLLGTKGTDYELTYTYKKYKTDSDFITPNPNEVVDAGYYNVKISATSTSKYYSNNTNTTLEFYVKYNLSTATMAFINPDTGLPEDSVEYTGAAIDMTKRVIVTVKDTGDLYEYGQNGHNIDLVQVKESDRSITNIAEHRITVIPKDTELVRSNTSLTKSFYITEVSLKTKATFEFDENVTNLHYTGGPIEPKVKGYITLTNKALVQGQDYRVSYTNNTSASGTNSAGVRITGLGSYACPTFTTNLTFTIKPLDLSDSSVEIEVGEATYNGYYINPEDIDMDNPDKGYATVRPTYALYCTDSKGVRRQLLEEKGNITNGDWKALDWTYNYTAKEKTDETTSSGIIASKAPYFRIQPGSSGNLAGERLASFTIKKRDVSSGSVTIAQRTAEYTGGAIDVSNVVKLTIPYTNPKTGNTFNVPLTQQGAYSVVGDNYDYEVTVTKDGNHYPDGKIYETGVYQIKISGKHNCEGEREETFEITPRSLSNNFHYYYKSSDSSFYPKNWESCYIPSADSTTTPKYEVEDTSDTTGLKISIDDVPKINSPEYPNNKPSITIWDKGAIVITQNSDGTTSQKQGRELVQDVDYKVTPQNNSGAGSAGWKKNGTSKVNADIADGSPYVIIEGMGNYKDSINIPYNIGKNINNQEWKITFKASQEYEYKPLKAEEPYNLTFEYNGKSQKPTVTVRDKNGYATLARGTDYEVTFTDKDGNEDAITNAGYKYVTITGIGDYCGTIKQIYSITRKGVNAIAYTHNEYLPNIGSFTNESPMKATSDGTGSGTDILEFSLSGSNIATFTETTAKKYLYDTNIVPTDDYKKFIGYYYVKYDGTDFVPTVTVKDKTLSDLIIDNDADLKPITLDTIENASKASTFKYDDVAKEWKLDTYCDVKIEFKVQATDSTEAANETAEQSISTGIGNYYVPKNSAAFHIRYILIPDKFDEKTFTVTFKNEHDGNKYKYTGAEQEPDILVKVGTKELVEDTDYTVQYKNNLYPGEASVVITGINNYALKENVVTKTFTIYGDLSDTVAYYLDTHDTDDESDDTFVRSDKPVQQYTGTYITYGEPEIYLFFDPDRRGVSKELALKHENTATEKAAYSATGHRPINNTDEYSLGGYVTYTGLAPYWTGEKEIQYSVEFNADDVKIGNLEDSYTYTGFNIIPDFKISVSTATVTKTEISKNDEPYTEFKENDLSNFEALEKDYFKTPGKFKVRLSYQIGDSSDKKGQAEGEYEIVPVNINSANVKVLYSSKQRYTGKRVKPSVIAYIASTNLRTNQSQMYDLTKDKDYTIDYNESNQNGNIENVGLMYIKGITSNYVTGTRPEVFDIVLGSITGLGVIENTGTTVTIKWNREIYSSGTELMLQKMNSSGTYIDCYSSPVKTTGTTNTYKFTGLASSTNYRVQARAYVNGNQNKGVISTLKVPTGVATTDITVTSNASQSATIKWDNYGDATLYYIYRAETATDTGSIVAIVPTNITSQQFTNTNLTSGKTYYYYVVGYYLNNAELTRINESPHMDVTVK
ncbi:hypothetical protein SAMN04487831_10732 [Pseudobutyrivibrio sp. UC1225]|uniref:hypothetical protein n=1 Tax=Pseudobutyrivibrio sp. UC1225 TaxID=1798185 RepID=UPI0008EA7639|nr:hypothetical protein [Pseudobutyrivibrio sp. UC1225]SFO06159.1 hypothetical protein SAMN04487831_10732 [Pseudobutyrivibrio sp. UC1225]